MKNSAYSQIYFFSNQVLMLSSNTISFSKLLKYVPDILLSFSGGIFIYLDTRISSKIKYSIKDEKVVITKIDAGQVLLEDKLEINYEETLMELYYKTAELGGKILYQFLNNFNDYFSPNLMYEEIEPINRGLPNRVDMKNFHKKGFRLFKFSTLKKVI